MILHAAYFIEVMLSVLTAKMIVQESAFLQMQHLHILLNSLARVALDV
jgi:hypothetical protein